MTSSSLRPGPAFVGAALLCIVFGGCSGGGAARAPSDAGAQNAAAFLPLGGSDLRVPDQAMPPPGLRQARAPRSSEPVELRAPEDAAAQAEPTRRVSPTVRPLDASGPQIRVTWEALAVERARLENPRFQRSTGMPLAMQQKVVLVNQGHVEAQSNMYGVTSRQNRGVAIAAIPDQDMQVFLRGLEQRGFFRVARPTSSVQHLLEDENSRGRITVERDGRSWTLVSMRGQGLSAATKVIPPLYSETKQSVMALRNQVSCMSVVGVQGAILTR